MISASQKILFGALLALLVAVAVLPAHADTTPTFFKDQRTGCNVGTFTPEPGLSVRWSGPCQSGLAEGSGTIEWLKNGVSTGRSDGAYHLGLREGQFAVTAPDGTKSVATFHDGTLVSANNVLRFVTDPASHCGVATLGTDPALTVQWNGGCANGKAEGPGVATWQTAPGLWQRTEATFHAGQAEGRGIVLRSDGARTEGELHEGRMNGRCIVTMPAYRIDTQCVDDKYNGPGVATFKDGARYEGEFTDGHMSGRGVFTTGDGNRMEGNFIDGVLNGPGRYVFPHLNESYEGNVLNGKYEGTGTYRFADGGVYEGEWTNNLPNGRGVYHGIPNGLFGMRRDFAGTWVDGCFAQAPLTAALFKKRAACGFDD